MEEGSRRAAAAPVLLDELIVEILAPLPFKSLCRCKCVSRAWRDLISDPANNCRFAQTLSSFFFPRPNGSLCFIGLSMSSVAPPPPGVDAALSFLPPTCGDMELLDSCNGLLLLCCNGVHESPSPPPFYVVCNPATGEWVTLTQPSHVPGLVGSSTSVVDTSSAALGFDPSISPHFHVFQLVHVFNGSRFYFQEVEIYSSQTGRWVLSSRTKCSDEGITKFTGQMTYFKGFLHICIGNGVASVDTEARHGGSSERGNILGLGTVVLLSVILRDAYFILIPLSGQVPCQSMFLKIMTVRSGYGTLSKASTRGIYVDQREEGYVMSTQLHVIQTAI